MMTEKTDRGFISEEHSKTMKIASWLGLELNEGDEFNGINPSFESRDSAGIHSIYFQGASWSFYDPQSISAALQIARLAHTKRLRIPFGALAWLQIEDWWMREINPSMRGFPWTAQTKWLDAIYMGLERRHKEDDKNSNL